MTMSHESIFDDSFVNYLGEGNPLEEVELSPEDKEALDRLSGAKYAREKKELEELREKVAVSELTGLLKWRSELAQKQIDRDLSDAGRHRDEVWLGIVDVDVLKFLNDTYGYSKTDLVLIGLAETLDGSLRKSDSCFQFGVDEFPVLLVGTGREDLGEILERVTSEFENKLEELVKEGAIPESLAAKASFSAGFVKARVEEDYGDRGVSYEKADKLFDRANENLHLAKKERNCVFIEGDESAVELRKKVGIDTEEEGNNNEEYKERYDW